MSWARWLLKPEPTAPANRRRGFAECSQHSAKPFRFSAPLGASLAAHEQDGGEQVLADLRDSLPFGRRAGFAGALTEDLTIDALESHKVGVRLRLVGHFVKVGFIAAHAHLLARDSLLRFVELFGALNLNHRCVPSFVVLT